MDKKLLIEQLEILLKERSRLMEQMMAAQAMIDETDRIIVIVRDQISKVGDR